MKLKLSSTRLRYLFKRGKPWNYEVTWLVPDDFGILVEVDKVRHLGSILSGRHH
jgi:hypothetical protein